jgi:ABC-type branched-subunit amino acid transport system ATPase component
MAPVSNGVPPLLVCERLAVSYDSVQVLFDVSVSVGAGQIVALLGTNGAGKTTLLRTISGLETQDRGRISFGGVDISRMDPTWRVSLGISQIAGGRAVAEGLTVAENLRMFGYSLGTDRAALRSGIEAALDAFPRLAERRNQAASTLSGGEKQMLALAKAFILRPRLLIIDEFSLGLAPKIVGELLPVVTRINQAGTAVLLVEQSVNIALSIAEHAYCMEKGEIVYDGAASRLRDDPELLRSVYLEGVSKALVR